MARARTALAVCALLACAPPPAGAARRELMLVSWPKSAAAFRAYADAAAGAGFSAVKIGASWAEMQAAPGAVDFATVDAQVAYARSVGLRVMLYVWLHRDPGAWLGEEALMHDAEGGWSQNQGKGAPSFANATVRGLAARFVADVATRYVADAELGFCVVADGYAEMEYFPGTPGGTYDYSPAALAAFRAALAC
eukprot:gene10330-6362_t